MHMVAELQPRIHMERKDNKKWTNEIKNLN